MKETQFASQVLHACLVCIVGEVKYNELASSNSAHDAAAVWENSVAGFTEWVSAFLTSFASHRAYASVSVGTPRQQLVMHEC